MDVLEKIQKQVDSAPIVIYMKGTPQFPQCGFSARAAQTLASTGVEFLHINILKIRRFIRTFQVLLTGQHFRKYISIQS
jgi:monothiol glutaredoxin